MELEKEAEFWPYRSSSYSTKELEHYTVIDGVILKHVLIRRMIYTELCFK